MIKQISRNKYRFIVNVGSGSSRKRYTKTITFDGGKKQLNQMYQSFEDEVKNRPPSEVTVRELLESHIEYTKQLGRKRTTIHSYEVCVERFESRFQRVLARDCTPYQIEQQIALMAKYGLSAKSIKNTIGLLSSAYEHGIQIGLVNDNPCKKVTLPKVKRKDPLIFSREDIQNFLYALADCPIDEKVAYELALFMGLRRSEICGLKESDVDIVNGTISIHNTRHRLGMEDYDSDTKSIRSRRVLAMPDILIVDIARLLETHRNLKYGQEVDYLIQDGYGCLILPNTLSARLRRLEEKHNLPLVPMHNLRHTYASLLNASGVDIARISAELGHASIGVTVNTYTHIFGNASASSKGIAEVINNFKHDVENSNRKKLPQSCHTNGNKKP